MGFLSYEGTLHLAPTLAVTVAAAMAGDAWAFRSGRRYGARVRGSRLGRRVGPERWSRADAMIERLGGRAMFGGRWVAFARTLIPRLAGSAGLSYRRMAPWNALGVTTWVGASVLVGFLAGTSYEQVSKVLGHATGAVLLLIGTLIAIVVGGRWLGRNPDPVRALAARAVRRPPLRWLAQRYGVLFFLLSMQIGAGRALLLNLAVGVGLLFAFGAALAALMRAFADYSGLSMVDDAVTRWMLERRVDRVLHAAEATVAVARGPVLIGLVAVVALALAWRARAWRGNLVDMLGTAGAFLPLLVLAAVTDGGRRGEASLLPETRPWPRASVLSGSPPTPSASSRRSCSAPPTPQSSCLCPMPP